MKAIEGPPQSPPPQIKLTALVGGGYEIRIHEADLAELGRAGLEAQVAALGFSPGDLGAGEYFPFRQRWVIPVRKSETE
ncbi:hypothetical protein D6T64_11955 [Cryobacterium melibiosiphilum]|uniref:Uncharacterized protein n=1 Tax=Cryobacterium melibiosiphilum TaxID=995039 RepID=A0A3A5MD95_9MICO|nr:hypothetical protein [Cryobacterium melibiosiphilum]RJT88097.1 hypothetical protein D6T64_11955 [Cryobacterium melibiosiphilum]